MGPDLTHATGLTDLMPGALARFAPLAGRRCRLQGRCVREFCLRDTGFMGRMAAWVSLIGLGVVPERKAMYLSGRSEVMRGASAVPNPAFGIIAFSDWAGITPHPRPTHARRARLTCCPPILGCDGATLATNVVQITLGSPLFVPHSRGGRAPLRNIAMAGTFAGLTAATGPQELTTAVLDDVAFSFPLALESLQPAGIPEPLQLR